MSLDDKGISAFRDTAGEARSSSGFDRDVPFPGPNRPACTTYRFHEMEPLRDSLWRPGNEGTALKNAAYTWARRNGQKVVSAKERHEKTGVWGIRVWRLP